MSNTDKLIVFIRDIRQSHGYYVLVLVVFLLYFELFLLLLCNFVFFAVCLTPGIVVLVVLLVCICLVFLSHTCSSSSSPFPSSPDSFHFVSSSFFISAPVVFYLFFVIDCFVFPSISPAFSSRSSTNCYYFSPPSLSRPSSSYYSPFTSSVFAAFLFFLLLVLFFFCTMQNRSCQFFLQPHLCSTAIFFNVQLVRVIVSSHNLWDMVTVLGRNILVNFKVDRHSPRIILFQLCRSLPCVDYHAGIAKGPCK